MRIRRVRNNLNFNGSQITNAKSQPAALVAGVLVLLMIIWGGSFIGIKISLEYLSPFELVLARFIPSALLLVLFAWLVKLRNPGGRAFWRHLSRRERLILIGASFFAVPAYHFCLNYGETLIPAGWAGLVISLNPAAIALFAAIFLAERVTVIQVGGIALAFLGLVYIALMNPAFSEGGEELTWASKALGMLITLGAVVSWGLFAVASKHLIRDRDPFVALGWFIGLGTLWFLPGISWGFIQKMASAPLDAWLAVGFLSIFCTVIGFIAWFWALEQWNASRAGAFIYLVPIFALLIGAWMLREPLGLHIAIGAALVLVGVILAGKKVPAKALQVNTTNTSEK